MNIKEDTALQIVHCENFYDVIDKQGDIENRIFYHLTHSDRLDSILSDGLKPSRGHHCKIIRDYTEPIIFLSKKKDVKFWESSLPDCDILLQLDCTNVRFDLRRRNVLHHSHEEYGCLVDISADHIIQIFQKSNVMSTARVEAHYRRSI